MTRPTWRKWLVPTCFAGAILLAGCGSATSTQLSLYNRDSLRFTYPASWHVLRHSASLSSSSNSLVYMSSQRLHFACTTTSLAPSVSHTTCLGPVLRLGRSGVLVEWDANGWPSWKIGDASGKATLIGGRSAKVLVAKASPSCAALGGQESINAAVAGGIANNYFTFSACIAGPKLVSTMKAVLESLHSTTFSDAR
jgi:hypothetical protein